MPQNFYQDVALYACRQSANRALRRLVEEDLAEVAGVISWEGGKSPANVYVRRGAKVKANQLKHDVALTSLIMRLGLPAARGKDTDASRRQDAILHLPDGGTFDLEVDTGSMTYDEVAEKRYPKYVGSTDVVLWASCGYWDTRDRTRMRGLIERAGPIADVAWFVTFGELRQLTWEANLVNVRGETRRMTDLLTVQSDASPQEWYQSAENSLYSGAVTGPG